MERVRKVAPVRKRVNCFCERGVGCVRSWRRVVWFGAGGWGYIVGREVIKV